MQISRSRLSDKASRLHPRRAAAKLCEAYEPEVPVKVREWIAPALASPDLVLESEPPAQPHSRVVVERAICFADGADTEVIGPPAKRAVQHVDKLCGLLPARLCVSFCRSAFHTRRSAPRCRQNCTNTFATVVFPALPRPSTIVAVRTPSAVSPLSPDAG